MTKNIQGKQPQSSQNPNRNENQQQSASSAQDLDDDATGVSRDASPQRGGLQASGSNISEDEDESAPRSNVTKEPHLQAKQRDQDE